LVTITEIQFCKKLRRILFMKNDTATRPRAPVQQDQSYPLISIVQLVTFCVALMTCIDFKSFVAALTSPGRIGLLEVIGAITAVSAIGIVIGAAIGLGQLRRGRSMLLCGIAGATVSLLILATFAAPAPPAQALAASLLPLVTTIILRSRTP
jgi:hypothetical protein